jgi:kynurenine formamidase
MAARWKIRPDGSNWGDYGDADQIGQMNLLTPLRRLCAVKEVREGIAFTLSLPLDYPGGSELSPSRRPPRLQAAVRSDGRLNYEFAMSCLCADFTDVLNDDAVFLYTQYSTQWDSLAHYGCEFDADGDGFAEQVYYNGFRGGSDILGPHDGGPQALALGIDNLATAGVQGRGVLANLRASYGDNRTVVGYDGLMHVIESQKLEIKPGDFLCLYTGFADLLFGMGKKPDASLLAKSCAALDGSDHRLLSWISDSGIVAICADNSAVEQFDAAQLQRKDKRHASLPLHEHCLFKMGIHLGELWFFRDLVNWLAQDRRSSFLLTAPPLRLPGSVGSPATPIATV